MNKKTTRFYLIRHGQTEWNRVNRLRGRSDISLNEVGFKQAEAVGEVLEDKPIVAVYSSPLIRAIQTAEAIADKHGLKPVKSEAFHDFDFGIWSGMERSKIYEEWKDLYQIYREQPQYFCAPEGETFFDVYKRTLFGLKELNKKHTGDEVVISSHNVTSVITMLVVLGLPLDSYWKIELANASISTFTRSLAGQFTVECMNDTCHLDGIEGNKSS